MHGAQRPEIFDLGAQGAARYYFIMNNDFKHPPLDTLSLLSHFEPWPNSHATASKILNLHGAILKAFDDLDRRIKPLVELNATFSGFNVSLADLSQYTPEIRTILTDIGNKDQEIQKMGAKGLAFGLVGLSLAVDLDAQNQDDRISAIAALREGCIASLPERCRQPWLQYVQEVEISAAATMAEATPAKTPRL